MTASRKFSEGDALYWVPMHRGNPTDVTVTKVGRKWLELSNRYRVSVDDLSIDGKGYTVEARCFHSQTDYALWKARNEAWAKVHEKIHRFYRAPDEVSTEGIVQIMEILGIEQ